jgi:hypothetical protein
MGGIRPGISFNAKELVKQPGKPATGMQVFVETYVRAMIWIIVGFVAFVAIVVSTMKAPADDSKTKQHLKELRQLDAMRDKCISTISDAQRNDNVWPDNATVSLQDCKDMAMKQIGIGMKLMEDSQD